MIYALSLNLKGLFFELTLAQMLILLFVLPPIFMIGGALIGRKVPYEKFDTNRWLYKTRKWERNGETYKKIFFVHKWKKFLPDGARFFKGDFTKKHLLRRDKEYFQKFVAESCRAELVHWLGILPFFLYFFLVPPYVAAIMVLYSLIVNIPCIIAQRYNRPRFQKLLDIM